jgi:hypothetical protein
VIRIWLRSLVNAILGRVPGKTSRLETATRMAIDADFSDRREETTRVRELRRRPSGKCQRPPADVPTFVSPRSRRCFPRNRRP